MIGSTISHYKILDMLGQGGMGEVYRAHDSQLGREVAIKVLPEVFTQDEERLARFEREARMLAALDHVKIASIYGLEEVDGKRFLVMELVEGETLAERNQKNSIPEGEVVRSASEFAEGGQGLHQARAAVIGAHLESQYGLAAPDDLVVVPMGGESEEAVFGPVITISTLEQSVAYAAPSIPQRGTKSRFSPTLISAGGTVTNAIRRSAPVLLKMTAAAMAYKTLPKFDSARTATTGIAAM